MSIKINVGKIKRTWKQRLFTLPWRPWVSHEEVQHITLDDLRQKATLSRTDNMTPFQLKGNSRYAKHNFSEHYPNLVRRCKDQERVPIDVAAQAFALKALWNEGQSDAQEQDTKPVDISTSAVIANELWNAGQSDAQDTKPVSFDPGIKDNKGN